MFWGFNKDSFDHFNELKNESITPIPKKRKAHGIVEKSL